MTYKSRIFHWPYPEPCPVSIVNADPHSIGIVGVAGSGGVASNVVVLEDALEKVRRVMRVNTIFFVDT